MCKYKFEYYLKTAKERREQTGIIIVTLEILLRVLETKVTTYSDSSEEEINVMVVVTAAVLLLFFLLL